MWLKGKPDTEKKEYLLYYKNEYYIGYFYHDLWYTKDEKILTDKSDSVFYQDLKDPISQDKLWIARDKSGDLFFYLSKPELSESGDYFVDVMNDDYDTDYGSTELPKEMYPTVTFENSPVVLTEINEQNF
jgi:hypothetical protein